MKRKSELQGEPAVRAGPGIAQEAMRSLERVFSEFLTTGCFFGSVLVFGPT